MDKRTISIFDHDAKQKAVYFRPFRDWMMVLVFLIICAVVVFLFNRELFKDVNRKSYYGNPTSTHSLGSASNVSDDALRIDDIMKSFANKAAQYNTVLKSGALINDPSL